MEILDFFTANDKQHWLNEIKKSDWEAGQLLYKLLRDDEFKSFSGEKSKVLLLTDGKNLASFCTYAEQDDVKEPSITPWAGFVYTFPDYRGKRLMGKLLNYVYSLAAADGFSYIHISTGETGLYEKYGCEFWKFMKNMNGTESRIYRKKL